MAMPLVYEEDTDKILGACFEVYKEKGFHIFWSLNPPDFSVSSAYSVVK